MINVSKIKINKTVHDFFEYETGKDGVKSITIQDNGIIKVEFDEEHDWNCKLFPISYYNSVDYNEK